LAKRWRVNPSAISKRKNRPDFAEWSREHDPEGIVWGYDPDKRDSFSPVSQVLKTPVDRPVNEWDTKVESFLGEVTRHHD
jgi:hypothetical protein